MLGWGASPPLQGGGPEPFEAELRQGRCHLPTGLLGSKANGTLQPGQLSPLWPPAFLTASPEARGSGAAFLDTGSTCALRTSRWPDTVLGAGNPPLSAQHQHMKSKQESKQDDQFNRTVDSRLSPNICEPQTRAHMEVTGLEPTLLLSLHCALPAAEGPA